jgi:putative ABC transport system permease protein
VLGTPATIGRTLSDSDAAPGVVLSQRTADAAGVEPTSMIGRLATVAGLSLPVIGVMAADVSFPSDGTELWIPASAAPVVALKGRADDRRFRLVARVKSGLTLQQVGADAIRVRNDLTRASGTGAGRPISVETVQHHLYGSVGPMLGMFLAAAGLVLLVASANVATLLLARAAGREREIAVRLALGAGRRRILGELFAEGLVLAMAGTALGACLAMAVTPLMKAKLAEIIPRIDGVAVDRPVLMLALAVGVLVALVCSIAPGFSAMRTDIAPLLRSAGAPGLHRRGLMTAGLVVAQIGVSTVLLVGAALLVRTVRSLLAVDLGVEAHHALTMKVMLSDTMQLVPGRRAGVKVLLDNVRALPGVQYAGLGTALPPNNGQVEMRMRVVDGLRDESVPMHLIAATPGYLEALGIRLSAGRLLTAADLSSGQPVVVISRSVARGLFAGRAPVDQLLPSEVPGSAGQRSRVVGVVDDVHYDGLDVTAGGAMYVPWTQLPLGVVSLVVRTSGNPLASAKPLRNLLERFDPGLPLQEAKTLDGLAERSIGDRRFQLVMASSFALLTLVIAVLGLVSALIRSIADRRHELAVRAAVGCTPQQLHHSVLRQAARLTGVGLACGLAVSLTVGMGLAHAFFGVRPYDALSLVGAAASLFGIALLASLIPARKASRIDPVELLRSS